MLLVCLSIFLHLTVNSRNVSTQDVGRFRSAKAYCCFLWTFVTIDPGGGLPYETDGDARRLA